MPYISAFSPCGRRVQSHRLQHLRRCDHWFPDQVTFTDNALLRGEDLLRGQLGTQITSSHHDCISFFNDLINVVQPLLILNLSYDSNVPSLPTQHIFDLTDLSCSANEGSRNEIQVITDGKLDVLLILRGYLNSLKNCYQQVNRLWRLG